MECIDAHDEPPDGGRLDGFITNHGILQRPQLIAMHSGLIQNAKHTRSSLPGHSAQDEDFTVCTKVLLPVEVLGRSLLGDLLRLAWDMLKNNNY